MAVVADCMFSKLHTFCEALTQNFATISPERKEILEKISAYIQTKQQQNKITNLVYICTHNSRRSFFGQIWAMAAAEFYNLKNLRAFSGGTEVTAFNPNAIRSLQRAGFMIEPASQGTNPLYKVWIDQNQEAAKCFSKLYDDAANPSSEFAAIMVCGGAEQNCPFIPAAELRISTTYDDPKMFDNTPLQDQKYDERSRQIATEVLYAFSKVNK